MNGSARKVTWRHRKGKTWQIEACREHAPKVRPIEAGYSCNVIGFHAQTGSLAVDSDPGIPRQLNASGQLVVDPHAIGFWDSVASVGRPTEGILSPPDRGISRPIGADQMVTRSPFS
jgi:hypothetical protein